MTAHTTTGDGPVTWEQMKRRHERRDMMNRISKRPADRNRKRTPEPTGQLDMFGSDESIIIRPSVQIAGMTYQEQFNAFNEKNPHVAQALAEMAIRLKRKGHDHYSIDVLFGVLRYRTDMTTVPNDGDVWKLNNNHRPYMSRFLMDHWPELDGFFETRKLKGE